MLIFDEKARSESSCLVAGVDEAGRGPLAGPVVAGAVYLKDFNFCHRIDDSKLLTPGQRTRAYEEIFHRGVVGIGIAYESSIDEFGILGATKSCMEKAILHLAAQIDKKYWSKIIFLVDGNSLPNVSFNCKAVISGDSRSFSIACASIVAKVTRDKIMQYYDRLFPQYGFSQHKGYGTKRHLKALRKFGPLPIHRMSFRPVRIL
jgi:ribonuclease HII